MEALLPSPTCEQRLVEGGRPEAGGRWALSRHRTGSPAPASLFAEAINLPSYPPPERLFIYSSSSRHHSAHKLRLYGRQQTH